MPTDGWSEDRILGGRLGLRQPRRGYRIAIDPILLAAAVDVAPGSCVLDLGSGVGAAALCLAHRRSDVQVVGLERDAELAATLGWNARANGLAARVHAVTGDAAAPPFPPQSFAAVLTNPPFLPRGRGSPPASPGRQRANVEGTLDLAGWLRAALGLVRDGGWLYAVHRADRLGAFAAACGRRAQGIDVLPLWPRAGSAAKRIVVRIRVGSERPDRLLPGLVLHATDGHFTPEAERILRDSGNLGWETP